MEAVEKSSAPGAAASRAVRRFIMRRSAGKRDGLFSFDREMIAQFAKNRLSSTIVVPILVLAMGFALAVTGDPIVASLWGTATLICHALIIRASRHFLGSPVEGAALPHWQRRFVLYEGLYGLAWGTFPLLLVTAPTDSVVGGVAIIRFAAVIVVLSVGTLLASPIRYAAIAGTLPIAVSMTFVHLFDVSILNVMIALSTLSAEAFFLYLASHLHLQHRQNLAVRAEKDALFAELEEAKAISDEARHRAEAASVAKSQFLATMSHELRTPLNAILGFSEVMRGELLGPIDNETYKGYLDDIHASGQHLLKLINEILDLSRIEAGKRELKEELFSLVDIAEEARGLVDLKARQKDIRIIERYDETLPRIVIDEQAIRQVLLNLLSNAIKFTPKNGQITIRVGRTQCGGQYLAVRDTGPGIPANEIPVVMSAFGQGSVSLKAAEQGTGLGIPIVQALVHLHGGNFVLRSKVGVGTEAIAMLPASRVVTGFAAPPPERPEAPREEPALMRKIA